MLKEEFDKCACLEHDLLLVALFELWVLTKNEAKHEKSRVTGGSGTAQKFGAVQELVERCQLCRCKARWWQIKQKLSRRRSQGRTGGLVLWEGAVWWQIDLARGFGRSENGSEVLHRSCYIC